MSCSDLWKDARFEKLVTKQNGGSQTEDSFPVISEREWSCRTSDFPLSPLGISLLSRSWHSSRLCCFFTPHQLVAVLGKIITPHSLADLTITETSLPGGAADSRLVPLVRHTTPTPKTSFEPALFLSLRLGSRAVVAPPMCKNGALGLKILHNHATYDLQCSVHISLRMTQKSV